MFFHNSSQSIHPTATTPPESEKTITTYFRDSYFALSVTTVFLLVGGYTAIHHEMWRDEIQAWLLARDSASIFELFANMKYEGHPALWHLCLMPLSRISDSPVMMQVLHLLIASVTVFLFTRYAPFNKIQKILFCFGYFALYEYAIVARNYALGVLLITVFCILYKDRHKRFVWIGIVLILLAHTSVHALIVTIAIFVGLLCEYLYFCCFRETLLDVNRQHVWIGLALMVVGIVTAVLQLNPPSDYGFAVGWNFNLTLQRINNITKLITQAMFPLPRVGIGFWGSHQLNSYELFQLIRLPLCYLIVLWCVLRFLKRPTALIIYLVATVGLLSFFYIKYSGSIRHHGFLFMTFVLASWIYYDSPEVELPINRLSDLAQHCFSFVFTGILIFHYLGGITAITMDSQHIFSNAKRTAEYIRSQGMGDMLMVGHGDPPASSVVGYLEKDQFYYPHGRRFGSFVRWDKARTNSVSNEDVLMDARILSLQYSQDVLLIMNRSFEVELVEQYQLTLLASFTGSTIGNEVYYLYSMGAIIP